MNVSLSRDLTAVTASNRIFFADALLKNDYINKKYMKS